MINQRRLVALITRQDAARLAKDRPFEGHMTNGDEGRFAAANYAMSFTKGLDHDPETLLIRNADDFEALRKAIDDGFVLPFTTDVASSPERARQWEAPTAGFVFNLQGPDPQAVTMPPAPPLGSLELTYEMAEVYELALLRDVPFRDFQDDGQNDAINHACQRLNQLATPNVDFPERPRKTGQSGQVTAQTLFRGSSPGVEIGPYLSQFLRMGNGPLANTSGDGIPAAAGMISYGAQRIDQRVPVAIPGRDYLMDEASFLSVQNGAGIAPIQEFEDGHRRLLTTPRDLATYVHFDALYQAYLNACLILLAQGAPFDPLFDDLSGMGRSSSNAAGGFALWGGPHILNLVTEVATRALKAVRYQKFNTHLRLRPEALAARVHKAAELEYRFPVFMGKLQEMRDKLSTAIEDGPKSLLDEIKDHPGNLDGTALLPMAFQEGSPMHPSYGAGHATVAGACVTMLKAFFDTNAVLVERGGHVGFMRYQKGDRPVRFDLAEGGGLILQTSPEPLTLEGELNKLAANISIGRNMAGVHFFSDYYDSLRMGETVALGILEEQALTYRKDRFRMRLRFFDESRGETIIGGGYDTLVS